MKKLGLIGYPLTHSFSQKYFTQKFQMLGLQGWQYNLYPLEYLDAFPGFLNQNSQLVGLNVTIPYKVEILGFLDELSNEAKNVGAVNTVKISIYENGKKCLRGYNTDVYGFRESLEPLLEPQHKHALILGSGGASKAVQYVLKNLGIGFKIVSRNPVIEEVSYIAISQKMLQEYLLVINTTPLGMYPHVDDCPQIPYEFLGKTHLVYDLVYNPEETLFLKKARLRGAKTKNGLEMLCLQAEKAWEIWNE